MSFFCFFFLSQSSPFPIHRYVFNALAPAALCGWTRPIWNAARPRPGVMPPSQSCFLSLFPLCRRRKLLEPQDENILFFFFLQGNCPTLERAGSPAFH